MLVDVCREVLHEGQDVGAAAFDERDCRQDDQSGEDHLRAGHVDQVGVVDLVVRGIRFAFLLSLKWLLIDWRIDRFIFFSINGFFSTLFALLQTLSLDLQSI